MIPEEAENEFCRGQFFSVVFAREASGREPAREFFETQHAARHAKSVLKVQVTVQRFASYAPGSFRDPGRFKPVEGGIHEFRDDQVRLLVAYDGKGRLLLLDGVVKKRDDLRPEDVERAKRVLQEHRARTSLKGGPR